LVLGSLVAGLSLSGCDEAPPEPARFSSITECVSAGVDQSLCQSGYDAAAKEYQATAPKFTTREECEAEWGSTGCAPLTPSSTAVAGSGAGVSNVFVPLLTGFVLSSMMQQRYYNGDRDYYMYGGGSYGGRPVYRNRSGTSVTLGRGSGGKMVTTPVNVNTTTVSRSGFGGMGNFRSSFGG
jgi:uncharacterized protein YgiB involved in biofilm formation